MKPMADTNDDNSRRQCEQCGAELPHGGAEGLCPKCLLGTGLVGAADGGQTTEVVSAPPASSRGSLQPGDQFGHYRIERRLGGGGMGMVFAAEDLESGRRVALKVLSQALDEPQSRERFFREGRLAAAINHPNSVYVFGTEEIAGIPVIAMELVAGGTLEEHVRDHGPMSPAAAVDAVLQIVAGLEAAQHAGILHRDVKPSNCFRDAEGAVKIGDFGLSISTTIRTEPALTSDGAFLGTPAFSSPEQLRGEELNARSDIYSVGATLFYLLTGRMPFAAKNVVALIAMILERPTPSPRDLRPEVPRGLANTVRRCLARQPGERFKNYEELRRALAPYSSAAAVPATLGLRFLAAMLDNLLIGLVGLVVFLPIVGDPFRDPFAFLGFLAHQPLKALALCLVTTCLVLSYYAILDGLRGATFGKALCRLRVVNAANQPPGVWRALVRALLCVVAPAAPAWLLFGMNAEAYLSGPKGPQFLAGVSVYVLWGLLFSTARRRNGFAAVQDLATKTRVVSQAAVLARPRLPSPVMPPPEIENSAQVGPYHILETLEQGPATSWFLGYDLRLLRRVWLRVVAPGTPAVAPALRGLTRIGRLRWLSGRRSAEDNWDAFEAPAGKPLVQLVQQPQGWQQVRYWLSDLANELSFAQKDGQPLPQLGLERVWITEEGRAKLLDFSAPGLGLSSPPEAGEGTGAAPVADAVAVPRFLLAVARASLVGQSALAREKGSEIAVPMPVHAREFLRKLPEFARPDDIAQALRPLLARVAMVTRARRALLVVGCVVFPLLAALGGVLGQRMLRGSQNLMELNMILAVRSSMQGWPETMPRPTDRQFSLYIADHYGATITNAAAWSNPMALAMIKPDARHFAEQSVTEEPAATPQERAAAEAALKPMLLPAQGAMAMTFRPWFMFMITLAIYVSLPAILAALIFRGGLVLWLAGVTFTRRDGAPASRLRLLWRALLIWCPFGLLAVISAIQGASQALGRGPGPAWTPWLVAGLVCGLPALSLVLPARGLADRLSGAWPVPR